MTYEKKKEAPTMLTITETAKKAGLAVNYIRSLVKMNKIIYVTAGNKVLINYDRFVDFLNHGEGGVA